jgi:hypothetical protein
MRFVLLCAATLAITATPALAQAPAGFSPTGQPAGFNIRGQAYVVDGYRGAKWGMTIDQVRSAVAKDFPGAEIGKTVADPVTRTSLFVVAAPNLFPGPGTAAITYMFGASGGRLFHVNVDWQVDAPTDADRAALTQAGSTLVADCVSYYWKLLSVGRGVPVGPNALVLFTGTGQAGGVVEIRLQGIGYTVETAKGEVKLPPPAKGPALLHLSFAQSDQPDVYTIKPGEF